MEVGRYDGELRKGCKEKKKVNKRIRRCKPIRERKGNKAKEVHF